MANLPIIAFDESGNTGQNLLDLTQPVFTLASVHFSEEEMEELLGLFSTNSEELHFSKLRRKPKGRKALLEFCNHPLINFSRVKYSVIDKRFATIAQIVDLLFEPVAYRDGMDLYQKGRNIVVANLLYISLKSQTDKTLVDQVLTTFVDMIRKLTVDSIENFYTSVVTLFEACTPEQKGFLLPILESADLIEEILEAIHTYSIDLAFPCFNVLCDWWYRELSASFDVIHDHSKQMSYWEEMVAFQSDPARMEEKVVGYGARTMTYPLRINEFSLRDSKTEKQIQLADLVASAVAYSARENFLKKGDPFARELQTSRLLNFRCHVMGPATPEMLMELAQESGAGANPLDYHVEMHMRNENKTS